MEKYPLSEAQRFIAQAIRCLCLERLCEMLDNPDRIKTELDAVQVGWVSRQTDVESLRTSTGQSIIDAKQLFTAVAEPTQEQKVLRAQLEKIQPLGVH
jgi:hypothetical protein